MEKFFFLVLLVFQWGTVYPICRPEGRGFFLIDTTNFLLEKNYCTNVTFSELQNYMSSKIGTFLIEHSEIGSIKTELVDDNKAKFVFSFSCINCQIKEIEEGGLNKLVELSNLTLAGNDFGSFDGTFINNDLEKFQYLNLTGNNIKTVERICWALPTLKTIVLRDNPIENMYPDIFKNCQNLQYLDISSTSIKLSKDLFENKSNLEELYLANLKLDSLEDLYVNLPSLTHLDLSENDLMTLDTKFFDYFKSLKNFDLSGNKIGSIVIYQNIGSVSLRQLFLQNNNITNISLVNSEVIPQK